MRRSAAILLVMSGLAGAAGVALAAVAAHRAGGPGLMSAATMLLIHAAATPGLVALSAVDDGRVRWIWVAAAMLAGAILFASAVALGALAGLSLFPMAAPLGGSIMIGSWVALAAGALGRLVEQMFARS